MATPQKSQKVLITGGTGSVGKALVAAFSVSGYRVSFQYCGDGKTAQELEERFRADAIQLDFGRDFTLPQVDFGIVINNAGVNISDVPTHKVTTEDWNHTLIVNLAAPFQIVRQCLPFMMRRRWGRIINISSVYGLRAVEGNCPYTVSKHGMSGLTKTIAREYAAYGISCNEICPGPINSEMMREIGRRAIAKTGGTTKGYLKEVCNEIPAKRLVEPSEVSALAIFLASPQAGYLNGASIPLDGAMIA